VLVTLEGKLKRGRFRKNGKRLGFLVLQNGKIQRGKWA
jgi:hypothetical protein